VLPAELMTGAVTVGANAGPELRDLFDELLA
jgi:hypothetical protein